MSSLKLGQTQEAIDIQQQIELYTKKIEHEKINLRLYTERYNALLEQLMKLQNKKQIQKTKRSKSKKRDPLYRKPDPKVVNYLEEPDVLFKEVHKKYYDMEQLRNEVNRLILENKSLKAATEGLRKEKFGAQSVLEKIKKKCEDTEIEIEILRRENEEREYGIIKESQRDLNQAEVEGPKENELFLKSRNVLEEQYLNLIGENIKREREHMKEVLSKANAHGLVAYKKDDDITKSIKDEEISDRTPILDIQIEKWKYFFKYLKNMLDKYHKNSIALKEALERIMKYLGVETYDDIPNLLEKFEEQMSSIEIYSSKLTIDVYEKEEQKRFIEMKIKQLESRSSSITVQRQDFIAQKKEKINQIRKQINDYKQSISQKEELFKSIKAPTDNFLENLEKTYISQYIPLKIPVNKDTWYNEQNILEILANIQDYISVAESFDKISRSPETTTLADERVFSKYATAENSLLNDKLEKLRTEMKNRIDLLKSTNQLQSTIKDKGNISFDETIKKLSDEIVKGLMNNQKGFDKDILLKKKKN